MVHVSSQGVFHRADTTVVDRGVAPCVVSKVAIDGNTDHFHVALFERVHAVVQSDQLGRAHKGEVQRVEEHQAILALDGFGQGELVNDAAIAQYSRNSKIRCRFTYQNAHCFSPLFPFLRYSQSKALALAA